MPTSPRLRRLAPLGLGVGLTASAALHLVRPAVYRTLIPDALPGPDAWVRGSGVVEGVCGIGLLTGQPWAGRVSAAVLLAIWPGNIQMALDAGSGRNPGIADNRLLAWGRLPLQLPMVWAALQSGRKH